MGFLDYLFKLFQPKNKYNRPHQTSRGRVSIGKSLFLRKGSYQDNNVGLSDYSVYYKVKSGRVEEKIIQKMERNEDTNMFNKVKITPITHKAFIKVTKRYQHGNRFEIWNVLLIKNNRRLRDISI